jgi:hypothetical protein
MGIASPTSPLRLMLEGQLSQLSSEVERLFDEARGRARRELADQLNQSVRRLRQAGSLEELAATLVDAAAAFAAGAAVLRIAGSAAKGEKIRGVPEAAGQAFAALDIPLSSAAALAGAVETRDPVIAATTAAEVSPEMMSLAGHTADGRVAIFPLIVKERVPVLLYCWGPVQGPALEMLTQVAAAVWDSLAAPEVPQLVSIAAAPVAAASTAASSVTPEPEPVSAWDALSPEEQAIHLRAQRFAHVRVAEMRLHEGSAVQSGRTQRDLYAALRPRIDDARVTFRRLYLAPCPSMVDYLHVELLRILAHDDADLLGKDYPGPLL